MIRIIIVCLFIIASQSFAYESPAYYVEKNRFSLDGYDFIAEDNSFPIIEGKLYNVVEEGEEQLAGDGYRKLVRITNPDTRESYLFTTRAINNTKRAVVLEAKETRRNFYEAFESGDGWMPARYFWVLDIGYDLVLEDGGELHLRFTRTYADKTGIDPNFFLILPRDQIEILSELRESKDFTRTNFQIKITRDEQKIGVFGNTGPFIYTYSVWGSERQDNWHGKSENIYVIKNTSRSNTDLFIDNLVHFYDIQGNWKMPHSSTYDFPPYLGRQFEFIEQLNDNELLLRPYHSDVIIKFTRYKN